MSNQINQEIATAASAAVGSKVMYSGVGATTFGFFLSNEFLGLAGLFLALSGFIVSSYYKRKEYLLHLAESERQRLEHEYRMEGMRK